MERLIGATSRAHGALNSATVHGRSVAPMGRSNSPTGHRPGNPTQFNCSVLTASRTCTLTPLPLSFTASTPMSVTPSLLASRLAMADASHSPPAKVNVRTYAPVMALRTCTLPWPTDLRNNTATAGAVPFAHRGQAGRLHVGHIEIDGPDALPGLAVLDDDLLLAAWQHAKGGDFGRAVAVHVRDGREAGIGVAGCRGQPDGTHQHVVDRVANLHACLAHVVLQGQDGNVGNAIAVRVETGNGAALPVLAEEMQFREFGTRHDIAHRHDAVPVVPAEQYGDFRRTVASDIRKARQATDHPVRIREGQRIDQGFRDTVFDNDFHVAIGEYAKGSEFRRAVTIDVRHRSEIGIGKGVAGAHKDVDRTIRVAFDEIIGREPKTR